MPQIQRPPMLPHSRSQQDLIVCLLERRRSGCRGDGWLVVGTGEKREGGETVIRPGTFLINELIHLFIH